MTILIGSGPELLQRFLRTLFLFRPQLPSHRPAVSALFLQPCEFVVGATGTPNAIFRVWEPDPVVAL